MTLKRLAILLAVLIFLAGVGIAWLWQYAYTPQGRARVIIAQLKNDPSTFRGWLLQHHLVRPGFAEPPEPKPEGSQGGDRQGASSDEMARLGPAVLPVVIEALQDNNFDVRAMAISACGKLRDPAAIQPLAKCMREARANFARQYPGQTWDCEGIFQLLCVDSMIEIGPEAFDPLLEASRGFDSDIRSNMPFSFEEKSGSAAAPPLRKLLEDSDGRVRASAAIVLGRLNDKPSGEALLRHLNDNDAGVVRSAAVALGNMGERRAIPSLLNMLKDKSVDRSERIRTAVALARMDRNEGLDFLAALLKSPDPIDRAVAAEQLGNTPVQGTYDSLLSLLADKDESASPTFGGIIQTIGQPELIIRGLAARALGQLHDPRAIPAVRKLLNDPDPNVRKAAADALEKLGAKPPPASQPGKP